MTRGAFNGYKVAEAWIYGTSAHSGAFRTDGHNIWTYGVLLAHKDVHGDLTLDVPEDWSYSVTSNKHFNVVKMLRDNRNYCLEAAHRQREMDDHQSHRFAQPMQVTPSLDATLAVEAAERIVRTPA